MNPVLKAWNIAEPGEATAILLSCCAARRWAAMLASERPLPDENSLYATSDKVWAAMGEPDWQEAFRAHPRIGDRKAAHATQQSKEWSTEEQSSVKQAQSVILAKLAARNREYEELFGFTYIVCATGKSAEEMLSILERRLLNDRDAELIEAAEQQRQITQIRLRKWLQP